MNVLIILTACNDLRFVSLVCKLASHVYLHVDTKGQKLMLQIKMTKSMFRILSLYNRL